jgi:hypothetical protein
MKKFLLALSLTAFIGFASSAQANYKSAVGIKFAPGTITYKHFIADQYALEGLVVFGNYGSRFGGLFEINKSLSAVEGLNWYYGAGTHLSFFNSKSGGNATVGIDGVVGLDYKFPRLPLNLSLDWQPYLQFGNYHGNGFEGNSGGIGVRYTIN